MTDVVLVTGSYDPREGGAERQMRTLLPKIVQRGQRVAVVTQVLPNTLLPRFEHRDGYTLYRVGSRLAFKYLPRLGQGLFLCAGLLKTTRLRPRTLVSLQMGSASVAAGTAARILSVRHIMRLTGGGTSKFRSEPLARASSQTGKLLVRSVSRAQTVVVAPAKHLLDDFMSSFPTFPGQTLQIINGVRLPDKEPHKKHDVIWYGRSGSEKSVEVLIALANALPHRQFSIIGRAYTNEKLPPNVRNLGWQDKPEEIIGQHRVLLNTSRAEGMPNTVLQAVAWGCRVVGFENAGMCEVQKMYPAVVDLAPAGSNEQLSFLVTRALDRGPVRKKYKPASIGDVESAWWELLSNDGESQNK